MSRPVPVPDPSSRKAIAQFSMIDAILAGDYNGGFAASEVVAAGAHGIGCGDALDGELVILDGRMLRCRDDGSVSEVDPAEKLPFAEVCAFAPTGELRVDGAARAQVEALFLRDIPSRNLFYALRVDGDFDEVEYREPPRQVPPYRPFAEVAREQHEEELDATAGSLIGFWAPQVFQGVTVAGFHLHFVNDARTRGGHVLDYRVRSGTLRAEAYAGVDLRLPVDPLFLDARFAIDGADAAVRAVEGSRDDQYPVTEG